MSGRSSVLTHSVFSDEPDCLEPKNCLKKLSIYFAAQDNYVDVFTLTCSPKTCRLTGGTGCSTVCCDCMDIRYCSSCVLSLDVVTDVRTVLVSGVF